MPSICLVSGSVLGTGDPKMNWTPLPLKELQLVRLMGDLLRPVPSDFVLLTHEGIAIMSSLLGKTCVLH